MDPVLLILTLLFWIIIAGVIGGVILLRPVSKQLGTFLEEWTAIRRIEADNRGPEIQMLISRLESIEANQTRLLESVDFHEKLAEPKED